jgi:hypothetical protein
MKETGIAFPCNVYGPLPWKEFKNIRIFSFKKSPKELIYFFAKWILSS